MQGHCNVSCLITFLFTWDGANPFGIMKSEFDPELISAYLDGELTSQSDRELVERHLAETSADAQMLDDFREMGSLLRELPSESTPSGLIEAVHNQIERETLLREPATLPRQPLLGSRLVQMVASASLLMLVATVGTFYYMSRQMTINGSKGENLIVMGEAALAPSDFQTDDGLSFDTAEVADSDFNEVIVEKTRGMKLSDSVSAVPGLEHRAAVSPAPAAMAGVSEGIPPLPAVLSKKSIGYINTLATSTKLNGILEPGELVQYISSNSLGKNVSVVELSVVDVEEAFGTIQVLLSSNQIVPISQLRLAGTKGKVPSPVKAGSRDENSDGKKDAGRKLIAGRQASTEVPGKAEKQVIEQEGMIALYVEASQEQVLSSLAQLDGLKNIREVYVGNVPNLAGTSYGLEPVASNGNTLQRFDINRDSMHDVLSSVNKKDEKAVPDSFSALKKNRKHNNSIPRWRVLTEPSEGFNRAVAQHSDSPKKSHGRAKREFYNSGKPDVKPQTAAVHNTDLKKKETGKSATGSSTGFSVVASINTDSYQVPVRLSPKKMKVDPGRSHALNAKPQPAPSLAPQVPLAEKEATKTMKQKVEAELVPEKNEVREIPSDRLRLLLIISLKRDS